MAYQADIPRLPARSIDEFFRGVTIARFRARKRGRASTFRKLIEYYESRPHCFCVFYSLGIMTMFKQFLTLLRAYLDARIDHAIVKYHSENHANATRALNREVAEREATVKQADWSLDDFAERAEQTAAHLGAAAPTSDAPAGS